MDFVDYWDEEEGVQKRRMCTSEEQQELDERRAGLVSEQPEDQPQPEGEAS